MSTEKNPYYTKFYPEKRKDRKTGKVKTKNVPILVSFIFDGHRFKSTTGIKGNLDQWSKTQGKFKPSTSNASEKNSALESIGLALEKVYLDERNKSGSVSIEFLKKKFRKEDENKSFIDYFDEFVTCEGEEKIWSKSTYQKFATLKKHLIAFQESEKTSFDFDTINEDFYRRLNTYFLGLGHINNTIKKSFKNLNWFLGWVIAKKKIKIEGYKSFTIKEKGSGGSRHAQNIYFLHPEEFLRLFEASILDQSMSKVRDLFCFSCATGLRYSDLRNLNKEDIGDDSLQVITKKGDDPINIPLNDYSREILNKYVDTPNKEALPPISNQKYNEYLKVLGKLMGLNRKVKRIYYKGSAKKIEEYELWEKLTTHVARKTFITLGIFLGMNSEVLMKITGHKSHEIMQVYYDVLGKQQRSEMDRFSKSNFLRKIGI